MSLRSLISIVCLISTMQITEASQKNNNEKRKISQLEYNQGQSKRNLTRDFVDLLQIIKTDNSERWTLGRFYKKIFDMSDQNGWTPLMWTCYCNNSITHEVIHYALSEYEGNPDQQSTGGCSGYPTGNTAAMIVTRTSNIALIAYLKGYGVDFTTIKDPHGHSAYDLATDEVKEALDTITAIEQNGYAFLTLYKNDRVQEYLSAYRNDSDVVPNESELGDISTLYPEIK